MSSSLLAVDIYLLIGIALLANEMRDDGSFRKSVGGEGKLFAVVLAALAVIFWPLIVKWHVLFTKIFKGDRHGR